MTPIIASAAQLPFNDNEFDVAVASDVLEHIPPDLRKRVIGECLRVARALVIFGFPCGQVAWESDRSLLAAYIQSKMTPPSWLTEHMEAPFPEPELFEEVDDWEIQRIGNESIGFHTWMMRREMSPMFVRLSSVGMRIVPSLLEVLLRKADRNPYYRQIVALRKRENKPKQ
jgi:predicted SAM-dependent methyltransferase